MGRRKKTVVLNNKHCLKVDVPRKIRFQFSKIYFVLNGNYNYKDLKSRNCSKGVPLGVGANGRYRRREILDFSF